MDPREPEAQGPDGGPALFGAIFLLVVAAIMLASMAYPGLQWAKALVAAILVAFGLAALRQYLAARRRQGRRGQGA